MDLVQRFLRHIPNKQLRSLERVIRKTLWQRELSDPGSGTFLKYWSNVYPQRWHEFGPPMRPSPFDIDAYRKLASSAGRIERALVLGATPELRDLLAEMRIPTIIVADYSAEMIAGMSSYLKRANAEREIWIKCDWATLPLPSGTIDLIIGDLPFDQIPRNRLGKLGRYLRRLLASNGNVVARVHFPNEKFATLSPQEIITETLQHIGEVNDGILRGLLSYRLLDHSRRPHDSVTDRAQVISWLTASLATVTGDAARILSDSIAYHLRSKINLSIAAESYFRDVMAEFFEIHACIANGDHFDGEYFPILRFAPRQEITDAVRG